MRNYTAEELDPFGYLDALKLDKFKHHLKIGMRVKVKDSTTGAIHYGVITNLEPSGDPHVLIDGTGPADSRRVQCSREEVWPETFPEGERPEPAAKPASAVAEKLAGFLANSNGLMKALRADRVSPWDRVHIEGWLDAVKTGGDNPDPFGLEESHSVTMLKLMAEKYRDAGDTGDLLNKAANTPHKLREGMTVRDKLGRKAKITKLDITHCELEFAPGHTGISLLEDLAECAA